MRVLTSLGKCKRNRKFKMAALDSRPGSTGNDNRDTDEPQKQSRRPGNSAFKQQKLKAWQPILTASSVLPVFFFIGLVFLPIGIGLLVSSNKVQEYVKEYTSCANCDKFFDNSANTGKTCSCILNITLPNKFSGPVYMYYGLSNYYQNHRRYVRSRDDTQLHGKLKSTVSTNCKPFNQRTIKDANNNSVVQPIAPCGAIANSFFNDTFVLYSMKNTSNPKEVSMTYKNIAWKSDRTSKFKNPSGSNLKQAFTGFSRPLNWHKNVWELDVNDTNNNGFVNQDFVVWMRVAAFPTFRKLYRIISDQNGLEAGDYQLKIQYNYPVHKFNGKKRVILSTATWIGGKNTFLGTAYIVVGSLCIVFGIIFFVVHLKFRTRSLKEWSRR